MLDQNIGKFFSDTVYGLRYSSQYSKNTLEIFSTYGVFIYEGNFEEFPITDKNMTYVECEINSTFQRGYKTIDADNFELSVEELTKIIFWISDYFSKNDIPDINLYCYDPNDNNLYQGYLPYSTIKENNYRFTNVLCEYAVAKYDELSDEWVEIYVIIREDGSYVINPDGYCNACVLFLSKKEWENLPPVPNEYDPHLRYNFVTKSWEDTRTVEELTELYRLTVEQSFDSALESNAKYYYQIQTNYGKLLIHTLGIEIDTTSENYNYGKQSVADLFNVTTDVASEEDFTKEFYNEQIKKSSEVIEGQKVMWLSLPSKIRHSVKYDTTTTDGWKRLISEFVSWFNRTYSESYPEK